MLTSGDDDDPLPLEELEPWISSKGFVDWIRKGDEKQAALEAELKENAAYNVANLFGSSLDEDLYDDDDGKTRPPKRRVQQWTSSAIHIDGIGGFDSILAKASSSIDNYVENDDEDDHRHGDGDGDAVQLVFLLSESYQGFGDTLWSSARYVGNVLADPNRCRGILSPYLERRRATRPQEQRRQQQQQQQPTGQSNNNEDRRHPLLGVSVLEIGAGAGLPSWSAMHVGARVVCTDLSDTNRIRSLAECACRNFRKMQQQAEENDGAKNDVNKVERLHFARQAKACPHDWGTDVASLLHALNQNKNQNQNQNQNQNKPKMNSIERIAVEEATGVAQRTKDTELFDVVLAADCCYMPWTHDEMLESVHKVLSPIGVALICFALHGNADDDDVWKIVDRAKERGFVVEVLPSTQLTPPTAVMEAKQGLVHTVRLSKPQ